MSELYNELKEAGIILLGNHESDLYIPVNDKTRAILAKYPLEKGNAKTFVSQIDGKLWFDVPFAYLPFWESRATQSHLEVA